ncbi:hypothetical protein EJ110_NYTH53725 [Nymphaea thermarum]|nr:hypothetical protein EJ110_NYTH53725 [Nymphaea thermarum]
MRNRRCSAELKVELLCEGCSRKKPHFFKVLIVDFKERLCLCMSFSDLQEDYAKCALVIHDLAFALD